MNTEIHQEDHRAAIEALIQLVAFRQMPQYQPLNDHLKAAAQLKIEIDGLWAIISRFWEKDQDKLIDLTLIRIAAFAIRARIDLPQVKAKNGNTPKQMQDTEIRRKPDQANPVSRQPRRSC